MTFIDKIGGRKFVLTAGCGMVTAILQAMGKLDPGGSSYVLVIGGTVSAYITGNVFQKKNAGQSGEPQ